MVANRSPDPVLLVVAAFSRHATALDWAAERLAERFGPVALASPDYSFHQTTYYEPAMGPDLRKRLLAFRDLVPLEVLPEIKRLGIALEDDCRRSGSFAEVRPLNLDPGVLSLGKFCLATTKDQAHRIYLRDGIFAEVTLRFREGAFEPWPWTYADYCQPLVLDFLGAARNFYRQRLGEVA